LRPANAARSGAFLSPLFKRLFLIGFPETEVFLLQRVDRLQPLAILRALQLLLQLRESGKCTAIRDPEKG
jgi:hypothetical protein